MADRRSEWKEMLEHVECFGWAIGALGCLVAAFVAMARARTLTDVAGSLAFFAFAELCARYMKRIVQRWED